MALQPVKLRDMSIEELDKEELALREEIWKLRLQRSTGQLADHHKVRKTRKDLARILTVKTDRMRTAKTEQQG